jgi:carboxypeptidase PM20D1
VIFAFGHDEEVGGKLGAQAIAARLEARGVHPELVLDEGGLVTHNMVSGVEPPVALIGVAEKGYLSVELSVATSPGHSSTPPPETAIGKLAKAVSRLEEKQMPMRLDGAVESMLRALAPAMSFDRRVAIANLWLFKPLLVSILSGTDTGRASLQTTTAPTIFASGDKDNVLPGRAHAVVNMRLLPGDTAADATQHIKTVVGDPSVAVETLSEFPASPVSDARSPAFAAVVKAIEGTMPGVLTAPYLTIGATDSTHYTKISPNVLRFLPARFEPDDMKRFHGTNERISVDNYREIVSFYVQLVRVAAGQGTGA